MELETIWEELLEYARFAPSPHNTQLWKTKKISPTVLDLHYDPQRLLPVENENGSFMTCGLGTFVEALSIAAAPLGYVLQVEYPGTRLVPGTQSSAYFCTLTLVKQEAREDLSRELLLSRRTSRLPYEPRKVEESILIKLKDEARRFGHEFYFSSNQALVHEVMVLNKDTLFYDMADTATRAEVNSWIRYTGKEARTRKDGLWTYCLRLPAILTYIFFNMHSLLKNTVLKNLVGSYYMRTMRGTQNIGWLAGPLETPEEWFQSGRMLMRLWLIMEKEHVYLHPFGSIITNPISHTKVLDLIGIQESQRHTLWLILRLGYSKVPPRSHRLSQKELMVP